MMRTKLLILPTKLYFVENEELEKSDKRMKIKRK